VTAEELLAFEEDIAQVFATGAIKAPIHLGGGNEEHLIKIFKDIGPEDWVLCGWRSHYHCLLKGVSPIELKAAILAGRSVSLAFPAHRVLCSGIVGGVAPIAVGLAHAIKARGGSEYVYCFLGDMSFEAGVVHEAMKYAARHDLPVSWIVEDNNLSVMTPTKESWGMGTGRVDSYRYIYKLTRPHSGIGAWVRF
jgi:pyruvate dehydrogenase E1 component alpha subunit